MRVQQSKYNKKTFLNTTQNATSNSVCLEYTKGKGKEKEEERKNITGIDRTGVIDYSLFSLTNYIN